MYRAIGIVYTGKGRLGHYSGDLVREEGCVTAGKVRYNVPLMILVILLALGTALTHLFLGIQLTSFGAYGLGILFILNFVGYIGLTGLLYLPVGALDPYRGVIRYVLIFFTALTIVLWVPFGTKDIVGYLNKVNELLLIVALVVESRLVRR